MYNLTIKRLYVTLFFIGLFFFSFNDYEGIPFLGEFKKEAGAIFFLLGFFFLVLNTFYTHKITIPYKNLVFRIWIVFILWAIICSVLNINTIWNNYLKHTYGAIRFIRQFTSLTISTLIFFLFYYNVLIELSTKEILYKIRKVFFLSFIVASIYGFLEILVVYFGFNFLLPLLKMFDYFPFLEVFVDYGAIRISSICYEPPFFAIYLITISGWMFSYVLTEKSIFRFLPSIIVLVLTYFTGSRTGLIVVFIQFLVFVCILYKDIKYRKYIFNSIIVSLLIFSSLILINGDKITKSISNKMDSLNFSHNLTNNISNQSRFGMQYAALQVFKENPIMGVGFGQQAYHSRLHYPGWSTKKNYEYAMFYKNSAEPSFPPGYNLYTRLLEETGLIGFFIFLFFIFVSIKETKKMIRTTCYETRILGYILFITFIGLYINWLQIDSFKMYGIWISIAILIIISKRSKLNEQNSIINSSL